MSAEPLFLDDLRASCDASQFGASLRKGKITIWNANTLEAVATVRPGFSGSSSRYAIDSYDHLIYFGIWEKGLTCFDFGNGRMKWKRKDILGIQAVNLSAGFPNSLFVTLELPERTQGKLEPIFGIAELDRNTGETRWIEPSGHQCFVHPIDPTLIIREGRTIRVLGSDKQPIGQADITNFAILDAAFLGSRIALAEGGRGVRVIDSAGAVICSYSPETRKPNCLSVAFDGDNLCIHDSWECAFVTIIDPISGRVIAEHQRLRCGDICFIGNGSRYMDQTGGVYKTLDGTQVGQVAPSTISKNGLRSRLRKWLRI